MDGHARKRPLVFSEMVNYLNLLTYLYPNSTRVIEDVLFGSEQLGSAYRKHRVNDKMWSVNSEKDMWEFPYVDVIAKAGRKGNK